MIDRPDRLPHEQAELQAFSRRLLDLMAQRGLSQSDLAREIWGTTQDAKGRDVARNRDRISNYVRGKQLPEPATMKKIADALSVDVAALAPRYQPAVREIAAQTIPASGVNLVAVGGRPDVQLLIVHKLVPVRLAAQIALLLAEVEDVEG